jgi:hypothetical protein
VLLRALALLLLAVAPAAAEPSIPANSDGWCATARHEVLVRDTDCAWRRIEEDLPREDPEGVMSQVWRGDLDGDGRQDLGLRWRGGCGTRECMHEVFVACRDGTYAAVFQSPLYASRLRVTPARRGWARIELEQVGDADARGKRMRLWSRMRMTATGYE